MSDTERAGGAKNAASKAVLIAEPMTVDQALAHAERNRWRKMRPSSLIAELALADEVERLRKAAHGRHFGETLGLAPATAQPTEDDDGA